MVLNTDVWRFNTFVNLISNSCLCVLIWWRIMLETVKTISRLIQVNHQDTVTYSDHRITLSCQSCRLRGLWICVCPPLWSRLTYQQRPDDCYKVLYRGSWLPEDESYWLRWRSDFSSNATIRSKPSHIQLNISQLWLDECVQDICKLYDYHLGHWETVHLHKYCI